MLAKKLIPTFILIEILIQSFHNLWKIYNLVAIKSIKAFAKNYYRQVPK